MCDDEILQQAVDCSRGFQILRGTDDTVSAFQYLLSSPGSSVRLALFASKRPLVSRASDARIDFLVVDWEHAGKAARQAGFDTEINRETAADLARVASSDDIRVICRINAWDAERSPREVDLAVEHGADVVLLPMARDLADVEAYLLAVNGRIGAGILVETPEAVASARELAQLPVAPVYVGFNDLAIARRSHNIFEPLVDGTVDTLAEIFDGRAFGFGGLTVVDGGSPIPCRLLLAEMVRTGSDFTFLRRSFKRDIVGRDLREEVERIHEACRQAAHRSPREVERDRADLVAAIRSASRTTLTRPVDALQDPQLARSP